MNKQITLRKSVFVGFSAAAISILSFSAQALPVVKNGSFSNTSNGPNLLLPGTLPTDWTYSGGVAAIYSAGGADAIGATNGGPTYLWGPLNPSPSAPNGLTASPEGGNYLASDSDPPYSGAIFQPSTTLPQVQNMC